MPPEDPLDPCREWLGIDAVDLGDHRRVLGVAADERDPLTVLRAAESRLARLRSVSAGSLEFVRAGFVKRVEAARESVLAEIAAAAPAPANVGGGTFRRPPPPSTLAPQPRPAGAPAPAAAAGPPPVPRPPAPPPPPPPVKPAVDQVPIAIRTTVYRKQTPVLGVAMLMLGLSALAAGLGYYVLVVKPSQSGHGERRAAAREDAEEAEEAEDRGSPESNGPTRSVAAPAADDGDPPSPRVRRRRPRTTDEVAQAESKPPQPETTASVPPVKQLPTPKQTTPSPAAEKQDEAGRAESRSLDGAVREAIDALRKAQVDAADELLKAAASRVRSGEARGRIAAWRRLAASYRRFLEVREDALDAVKPGATYDVQGQKVVVEKLDAEACTYRATGPSKTTPRTRIPAGILLAIVAERVGDDPEGLTAIGAYQLARQEPDLQRARAQFEKARDAGADVAELLRLLDDAVFAAEDPAS